MRLLIIIVTVLIPTFIALTANADLEFLLAVGIFLQLVWSSVLLIALSSVFVEPPKKEPLPTTLKCSNNYEQFLKGLADKEDSM